ncbi:unnamed protein product, partial [marine sediment metagenome]
MVFHFYHPNLLFIEFAGTSALLSLASLKAVSNLAINLLYSPNIRLNKQITQYYRNSTKCTNSQINQSIYNSTYTLDLIQQIKRAEDIADN